MQMTDAIARVLHAALTRNPQELCFDDNSYHCEEFIRESRAANFAGWCDPEQVATQISFILGLRPLPKGAHALDVACGHGLHSVALHAAGLNVVGTDISETLIAYLHTAHPEVAFDRRSFVSIDYDQSFDLIIVLGNSLGLVPEDQLVDTLPRLKRALRPKGTLVLEMDSRQSCLNQDLEPRVWTLHANRWLTLSHRHYDSERKFERLIDTGLDLETLSVDQFCSTKRLYTYSEIEHHLGQTGLKVMNKFGDWSGTALDASSQSMVLFAEEAS
jgi:SAM-dependent methyltransferase